MMTAQRQRGRRRTAQVTGALALVVGMLAVLAAPAAAATATVIGSSPGRSGSPHGTLDGETHTFGGGLFRISIDGVEAEAYCIDIQTGIGNNAEYSEVDWADSGVDNLPVVEAILANYFPNGNGPDGYALEGSDAEKAQATQAAIWHFTDGFELTEGGPNSDAVVANYLTILSAVEDEVLEGFGEPSPTLSITPPESTTGPAGSIVGPYVVHTTADEVTVTPSDGVSLVDAEGNPITDAIVDGTELYLVSGGEGDGSISATASASVLAGRVFTATRSQTLILATTTDVSVSAEAAVSFTPPPSTTDTTGSTTTTVEETTTTVPVTPETSEVETTTTVPVTTNQGSPGGGLPVTGAQSLVLAAVALVLVGLGVGFRYVSKRADSTS